MLSYKKFSLSIIVFVICFLLYNAVVWKFCTEELMTDKYFDGGDLARMGYVSGSKFYRRNSLDLPKRHQELEDYHGGQVDVLVIGDSFSNGGGGGRNNYYQDYLASFNDFKVLNVEPYADIDFISLAACYANNGFLEKTRPHYLLISCSEKFCIERFSRPVDLNMNLSMSSLATLKRLDYHPGRSANGAREKTADFRMINEGNFKYLLFKLYYHFSDHAFFSKTYKKTLTTPMFSVEDGATLLFFRDDVRNIGRSTPATVKLLNDNLNCLADKLAGMGIKLCFMPCVDKYDLYSEFIRNSNYPKSVFFELLRPLPRKYTLIDTKAILLPEVEKGVKDVFYADDTHWSWKASEKIFSTVRFR